MIEPTKFLTKCFKIYAYYAQIYDNIQIINIKSSLYDCYQLVAMIRYSCEKYLYPFTKYKDNRSFHSYIINNIFLKTIQY